MFKDHPIYMYSPGRFIHYKQRASNEGIKGGSLLQITSVLYVYNINWIRSFNKTFAPHVNGSI